jgi:hypothetical protein
MRGTRRSRAAQVLDAGDHGHAQIRSGMPPPYARPVPVDFILFALTLLGVALFHKRTLEVALTGLA